MKRIAVASRTFSRHPVLRAELGERYPGPTFNEEGRRMSGPGLIAFVAGHDAAITALEPLDAAFFAALPELETVSKNGVGLDMIDLEAMARHRVKLGWKGGVNKRSVSELVISLVIALLRHVPAANRLLRDGDWTQPRGRLISGRTVGIVGCGHVGKDLAVLLKAFGCTVLAHDILDFPDFYAAHGVEPVGLEELLERSDIVTLHLPLDSSTRNILDAGRLARMRPDALLVNIARGGLIDEAALKEMLKDGRLAGAALDVFDIEPPEDRDLLELPNLIATPHIGGSSEEAILAMGRAAIEGLETATVPGPGHPGWPRVPLKP